MTPRMPRPIHQRKDIVTRVDTVLSQKTRFSVRGLFDRDDNTSPNAVMPGVGTSDNVFPGNLITGTVTPVLRPTVVNEITVGDSWNHWGFKAKPGPIVASDYTQWYRSSVGIDPPRLAPFGAYGAPHLTDQNSDQYPYLPYMLFSGGSYASYGYGKFAGPSGPMPRWNQNKRYTFSDDLSIVKGRHSFKFGFSTERDSKTEPGSQDYAGSYNFGHNSSNPLSTGDGYANALIGVFTNYNERDKRRDYYIFHWLTEGYAQDTWRMTPRLTLDYGVRITHNGSLYDTRGYNAAFDPAQYNPSRAPTLFTPYCTTGVAGDQSCSSSKRAALNPLTGAIVPQAFAGTVVPGSGSIANGQFTGGRPGMKAGQYDTPDPDLLGPARSASRGTSSGTARPPSAARPASSTTSSTAATTASRTARMVWFVRQVLDANISDIAAFVQSGNLAVTPQNVDQPYGYPLTLYGQDIAPTQPQAEKAYQGNFAVQRDIGFNTVVEVAWVGNYGRHYWQTKTTNNIPVYAYANTANLFNNQAISANFLRQNYPGIGNVDYGTTDMVAAELQLAADQRPAPPDPRPAVRHGLHAGQGPGHARLGLRHRADVRRRRAAGPLLRSADRLGPGRRAPARRGLQLQLPDPDHQQAGPQVRARRLGGLRRRDHGHG